MPAIYYPAVIDRSASSFGASFPDFPGCVASGGSPAEAALNAESALALHVEAMVKDKDALPDPSPLEAIEPVEGADDVALVLVRVDTPAKVERVLVSLDSNLLRSIDAVASNRSAWIAAAAREALARSSAGGGQPVYKRIEEIVRQQPGLSEAEIAKAVFGPAGYQQQVNADCRWLTGEGRIVRVPGRPVRYYLADAIPEAAKLNAA